MSVRAGKYVVDVNWQVLLTDLGLSAQDLLRRARLPLDLFSRKSPTLDGDEYFRLWHALADSLDDPAFPLMLGQAVSVEAFSPPIFACFCSDDLNAALTRLAQYKPMMCPIRMDVDKGADGTSVAFAGLPGGPPLPDSVVAMDFVFLVHLARLATRERVVPQTVRLTAALPEQRAYEAFFGAAIERGETNHLVFAVADARKPFLTANEKMWSAFEPELRTRMADLEIEASFRARVRTCLMEVLASGNCTTSDVARRLAVSTRTLQRRLRDEGSSFQQELAQLREELARHYLTRTRYSSSEISFLLGYNDPNSFIRAFHAWTGQTPELARSELRVH